MLKACLMEPRYFFFFFFLQDISKPVSHQLSQKSYRLRLWAEALRLSAQVSALLGCCHWPAVGKPVP